jgi:hypothetical protein
MPFKKGVSGNPGGRPKKDGASHRDRGAGPTVRAASDEALVKIATTGKSDSARVAAATAILDRAFGRTAQTLRAQNENPSVQHFISGKPLTAEDWEQKYCAGN